MNGRTAAIALGATMLGILGLAMWLVTSRGPGSSAETTAPSTAERRDELGASPEHASLPPAEAKRQPGPSQPAARSGLMASPGSSVAADAGAPHSLDREGVYAAMEEAMPEVEHCYAEWLKMEPRLGGKLTLDLEIDTEDGVEGRVARITTTGGDGGTGNAAFEGCVLSVVSGLRFKAPLDGARTVTQPFSFVAPPAVPERLRPELQRLCQRLREEALRPEHAHVQADDLLTVVLGSLEKQTPGLGEYTALLLPTDVPPLQRKRAFERGISSALGAPWDCPEFVRLWNGEPVLGHCP